MELFQVFMEHFIQPSDELYILGDFFEVWIGDDDHQANAEPVIALLHNHPGKKYLMHGNRDFLMGEVFATACGAVIIQEPYHLQINDTDWVLLHGDSLCTDDVAYQQFKTMVRDPAWQNQFLSKPLDERRIIAQTMRDKSKENARIKSTEIMDVNHNTVLQTFSDTSADVILHGHTHRQNRHHYQVAGQAKERIVLGDWGETCSVLVVDGCQIEIQNYTLCELNKHSASQF